MAEALSKESDVASAVATLTALIKQHGKGNPPRLKFDRLASLYDKAKGIFPKDRLGKFKKFVSEHFKPDEDTTEVMCKPQSKKKRNEAKDQPVESQSSDNNPNHNKEGAKGKQQTLSCRPMSSVLTATTSALGVKGMKQHANLCFVDHIVFLTM